MKADQAPPKVSTPPAVAEAGPSVRRTSKWLARIRETGFWAVVLVLLALNLGRLRNLWPPVAPAAIAQMVDRNRLDDAESALRDRLRRDPFEGDSRIRLAQILIRRGDMAGASGQFRQVPAWWPSKPEALFREGQAAMAAGLAVEAEAAWRACLADDPLHPAPSRIFSDSANELLGLLNLEGRFDESIDILWSISERSSEGDRPAILQSIMDLRLQGDQVPTDSASLAGLRRFEAADPGDVSARLALARAARAEGKWDEALHWVDSALAARPDNLAARSDRLATLEARGDRLGFQAEVARLPRSAEDDADGKLGAHRGLAREFAGDPNGAEEFYRKAIVLRPADESLLDRSSKVAERLGDTEAARTRCRRAQAIREARRTIPVVARAVLDAINERRPNPEVAANRTRLADLAKTLGWDREAAAWKRLAEQPARP